MESNTAGKPRDRKSPPPAETVELRYRWRKGQTYVYRVKIVGRRGYYSETLVDDVACKFKSVGSDETELSMKADLTRGRKYDTSHTVVIGGPPVRFFSNAPNSNKTTVTVDSLRRAFRAEGNSQPPYPLGDLSQLRNRRPWLLMPRLKMSHRVGISPDFPASR